MESKDLALFRGILPAVLLLLFSGPTQVNAAEITFLGYYQGVDGTYAQYSADYKTIQKLHPGKEFIWGFCDRKAKEIWVDRRYVKSTLRHEQKHANGWDHETVKWATPWEGRQEKLRWYKAHPEARGNDPNREGEIIPEIWNWLKRKKSFLTYLMSP